MSKNPARKRGCPEADNPTPHDPVWRTSAWRTRVRNKLLDWFDANARDLPWRRTLQPYHVWVSEIMLQQTQVATVLPYYERFLAEFPSIARLAAADEQTLLGHWEGLGYYRRARSMHAAAKQIVAGHDGKFPDNFDDVLALPGIGRYTAGAILSISGDARLPILEGNTQRVFSRWVAMRSPPTEKHANRLLWKIAETMLPRTGAGDFNQAAMELGALICTPRAPDCRNCPIRRSCRAHRLGIEAQIPGKVKATQYEDRTEFAFVIPDSQQSRYLLRPLPDGGRWAGLWDFPRTTETSFESATTAADWLAKSTGIRFSVGARLRSIKHAVTKYRISLHVHSADLSDAAMDLPQPWRFVAPDEMVDLPMSVTGRKIASALDSDFQAMLPL